MYAVRFSYYGIPRNPDTTATRVCSMYVAYHKPESVVMDNTVLLLSVQITKTKI